MTPSKRSVVSHAFVWTAGLIGVVHAGFSAYWALGGRWLLATVGQWAVDLATERPLAGAIALGLVAAAKLLGATIPIGVAYRRVPWPRFCRAISWAGGLLLVAYGGVNTVVALAVLGGAVRTGGGYDAAAMRGHAYLWDPLFLLWGGALVLSLWLSRQSSQQPGDGPSSEKADVGRRRGPSHPTVDGLGRSTSPGRLRDRPNRRRRRRQRPRLDDQLNDPAGHFTHMPQMGSLPD